MTDFVYDGTSLPDGKSDLRPITAPANKSYTAAEWNTVMAAIADLRDAVLSGDYHGLISNPSATVSTGSNVKLRNNAGSLEISEGGEEYRALASSITGVYSAEQLGIKTTNTGAQNSASIAAAFASVPVGTGWHIKFGTGTYNFSEKITITRPVVLEGVNNAGGTKPSTWFYFPNGSDGIQVNFFVPPSDNGSGAVIRNLGLYQSGATTTGTAFIGLGVCIVENLFVTHWADHGITIQASTGDGNNANVFKILNCTVGSCGTGTAGVGHGFYFNGADANAGIVSSCLATSNTGIGFYDSSFLGNTFIACETDGNVLGSYKCDDPNARTAFLNCYVEGGQPAPDLTGAGNAVWFAGLAEGGVTGGTAFQDGRWTQLIAKAWGASSDSNQSTIQLGSLTTAGQQTYVDVKHVTAGNQILRWNSSPKALEWYDTTFGTIGERWASLMNTSVNGRWATPSHRIFPEGFYVGTTKIKVVSHVPDATDTAGVTDWAPGDLALLDTASAGEFVGWVCTVGGTSGAYGGTATATANGTTTVTLNHAAGLGYFGLGSWLTINATRARVTAVNANHLVDGVVTLTMDTAIPAGSGLAVTYSQPTFVKFGKIIGGIADSTGTPGAATQNTRRGRVAIAAAATNVVVTNSLVTTSSVITAALQTVDGTLTQILTVVPASGSFTITGNAAATAATNVCWVLEE